jgi:hypothetical protein
MGERWEYVFVEQNDLNKAAAEGWRVVPLGPVQQVKEGLAGLVGSVLFLMERQVMA